MDRKSPRALGQRQSNTLATRDMTTIAADYADLCDFQKVPPRTVVPSIHDQRLPSSIRLTADGRFDTEPKEGPS